MRDLGVKEFGIQNLTNGLGKLERKTMKNFIERAWKELEVMEKEKIWADRIKERSFLRKTLYKTNKFSVHSKTKPTNITTTPDPNISPKLLPQTTKNIAKIINTHNDSSINSDPEDNLLSRNNNEISDINSASIFTDSDL